MAVDSRKCIARVDMRCERLHNGSNLWADTISNVARLSAINHRCCGSIQPHTIEFTHTHSKTRHTHTVTLKLNQLCPWILSPTCGKTMRIGMRAQRIAFKHLPCKQSVCITGRRRRRSGAIVPKRMYLLHKSHYEVNIYVCHATAARHARTIYAAPYTHTHARM